MVVVYYPCLLLTVYYLYVDAGVLQYAAYDTLSVARVPHCRRGAGTIVSHLIYLHQLPESLHQPSQFLRLLLRQFAKGEHIESESQRHTQQESLLKTSAHKVLVLILFLYKQSHGVGPYVYRRITLSFLISRFVTHVFCLYHYHSDACVSPASCSL